MEGLYFEVKPRRDEPPRPGSSEKPRPKLTPNHRSCPALSNLTHSTPCPQKLSSARKKIATWGVKVEEEGEEEVEEEVRYKLRLIGCLPVHHLTTMAMLPWVVAEISKSQSAEKELGANSGGPRGAQLDPSACNQTVFLCVSALWVRCVCVLGEGVVWDPLTHTVLFECRPHQVTKLIHNSQEPRSFGCLVREAPNCACYVFQCQDSTKPVQECDNDVRPTTCCSASVTLGLDTHALVCTLTMCAILGQRVIYLIDVVRSCFIQ